MGIQCRIIRNPQTGKIENVEAPNGEQSRLYLDALAMTQNEEEALDLWATSYIDEFKEIYGNSENSLMLQDSVRFQQGVQLKYNSKGQHLAPNGKPSNLTEAQAKQVRTKAFKDWFGDWENNPQNASKVVDENGEPLVVYHGTSTPNLTEFETRREGTFFTDNIKTARGYANDIFPETIGVFLNIKNPTINTNSRYWDKIFNEPVNYIDIRYMVDEVVEEDTPIEVSKNGAEPQYFKIKELLKDIEKNPKEYPYNIKEEIENDIRLFKEEGEEKFTQFNQYFTENETNISPTTTDIFNINVFRDTTSDGIIFKNISDDTYKTQTISNIFVTKNPNQIKSATDNIGTFDSNNNDIRFQIISEKGAQKVKEYKNLLDKAKELEKNNVSLSDITDQTGWFKYKGSWRFFSNEALEQFKINENAIEQGTEQKLSDILSTDNILFDMYPTLGAVKIVASQDSNLPKNASYNEGGKIIKTNLFKGRELEAAIAHEVTHFIQQREGLPQGGNYEFLLQQLVGELNFVPKNTPLSLNYLKDLLNKNRTADNKSTVDAVLSLVDNNTDEVKYKVYRAIMGEMDAHMVTKSYTNRETPYTYLELLDEELIEQRIADTDVITINSQGEVSFTPKPTNTSTKATQQIIDQLKKTGLADNVYQLSSQEIENKLKELGISEELRKQVSQDLSNTPTWISNAKEGIAKIKQTKATPEQWVKQIADKGGKGTTQELEWIGLQDFLDSYVTENNTKSVPKEVVEQYINDNQIEIVDVSKNELEIEIPYNQLPKEAKDAYDEWSLDKSVESFNYLLDELSLLGYGVEELDNGDIAILKTNNENPVKYSEYQLKGGENYREVLLTLPRTPINNQEQIEFNKLRDIPVSQLTKEQFARKEELVNKIKGESKFKSSHWDEANILAHLRLNERILPNGERVLFIEEVQSDWAQEGREQGFSGESKTYTLENTNREYDSKTGYHFLTSSRGETLASLSKESVEGLDNSDILNELLRLANRFSRSEAEKGTPQMPYKKTDQWVGMAMRRAMQMAAQEGFDRVAWVTGEQSADRYSLKGKVDSITVSPTQQDNTNKIVYISLMNSIGSDAILEVDQEGKILTDKNNLPGEQSFLGKNLSEVIGKEMSEKVLKESDMPTKQEIKEEDAAIEEEANRLGLDSANIPALEKIGTEEANNLIKRIKKNTEDSIGEKVFEGEDLEVGGEGMKTFYNSIVPKVIKKEARRFDKKANVDVVDFNDTNNYVSFETVEIDGENFYKLMVDGEFVEGVEDSTLRQNNLSENEEGAKKYLDEYIPQYTNAQGAGKQLSLKITPKMKENLSQGVPLFQKQLEKNGIKVIPNGFVINNEVYLNKDTMNDTTPIHEFNHLYNSWLRQNRPEVYKKGLDLVKAELGKTNSEIQDVIDYVKNSQPNLEGEKLKEEILTELVGRRGLEKITDQKQPGIIEWLKEAWQAIKDMLGISQMTTEQILNLDLQSYADAMAVDLLSGENFIGEQGDINFNRWKGENKFVEGSEVQDVKTGQPIVVKGYHGTTNEFYEFDSSVKGNIEGHLGKVNYFTTDFQDASINYQADGADITGRIDRRQDELEDTLRYDYQSSTEGLNFQEIIDDFNITEEEVAELYPKGKPEFIQAEEISRFIAEKELKGGTEKVLELFIKLNNPVVLGNNSSWFETLNVSEQDINEAAEEIAEENDISIEDAKDDYYFDIQQRAVENIGYENLHVDALTQALEDNGYEGNIASEILGDNFYESEIDLNELEKRLREAELYDNFEGELAQPQVIADFFKNLGFDGIILTDVNQRFRNMNIGVGSSHIHIFDEFNNQIKLADGSNVTFGQSADIRYQTKPSPFTDENGETKIENVLEFLKEQNRPQEVEPLTAQEKITVANIIRTKQISSQELSSELNRIFADSKFNKEVLNNSSIFSRAEAIAIQQSEEYIENLKELSEKEIDVEDTVDYPQEFLVLDGTINKYGLYNTQNPLTVEETVKEQAADTENYEEFANKFNQLDYPDLVNKFNEDPEFAFTMYSKYAQLKKMPSLDSELQPNQTPNKVTEVENSLDISKMNTSDINYLLDVSSEVWNESETQITKALDDIAKKAEVAGLDLSDLSDTYYTKTQEEIEDFLRSITTLKEDVTEETLSTFLESYRDFFNIEIQEAQVIEEVNINHRDKALEKIDDRGLSEYTLFKEEGLLKVAEQTYQRVEKVSLENLYEMVYAEAVTNDNRVMPNTAYFNSPRPNNQKLQDPQSKEEILNNIRIFIENNVSLLNLDTDTYDSSVAQQMLLYKYFFEAPITVETTTQVEDAIQEIENFDGDSFYLSSAFHTDFQANKLREKRRNSAGYQNFYKHFTVDQNGLKLIEDNRITIQQLKENIPEKIKEDFKNYGAVSRNSSIKRIVKETENKPYFNSLAAQRNFYQNNIESLTPFRGDYQNIGEGRIATTEYPQPFLRIGNKLYEKSNAKSGTSFYGKIPINNSSFNLIQEQGIINKFGEQDIKSYIRNQENIERNSNFYTKEELEKINQKHFNCGL